MGTATAEIGLVGLAVMGQNLALNVAEKVFIMASLAAASFKIHIEAAS